MSIVSIILRKLTSFFKWFFFIFKKIFSLCRGRSRVAELPMYVKNNESNQQIAAHSGGYNYNYPETQSQSWNSWDDKSFGIETKIEEYRNKRLVSNTSESEQKVEQDYFSEMQPEIKAPKKVDLLANIKPPVNPLPQKNLFEFKEDYVDIRNPGDTLGDLDFEDTSYSAQDDAAWDVDVDLDTVDHALKEANKREREQARLKRQQDHEKRRLQQQQKQRSQNSQSTSISMS